MPVNIMRPRNNRKLQALVLSLIAVMFMVVLQPWCEVIAADIAALQPAKRHADLCVDQQGVSKCAATVHSQTHPVNSVALIFVSRLTSVGEVLPAAYPRVLFSDTDGGRPRHNITLSLSKNLTYLTTLRLRL